MSFFQKKFTKSEKMLESELDCEYMYAHGQLSSVGDNLGLHLRRHEVILGILYIRAFPPLIFCEIFRERFMKKWTL